MCTFTFKMIHIVKKIDLLECQISEFWSVSHGTPFPLQSGFKLPVISWCLLFSNSQVPDSLIRRPSNFSQLLVRKSWYQNLVENM